MVLRACLVVACVSQQLMDLGGSQQPEGVFFIDVVAKYLKQV